MNTRLLVVAAVMLVFAGSVWLVADAGAAVQPTTQAGCALGQSPMRLQYSEPLTATSGYTSYVPLVEHTIISCTPGTPIADVAFDVSPAYIDVLSLDSNLAGQTLLATFHIRDVPPQLVFNRVGIAEHYLEYSWEVLVDVDNNPQTGDQFGIYRGTEYFVAAMHFVFTPNASTALPIPNGVQVNVWQFDPSPGCSSCYRSVSGASLAVDSQADTLSLSGTIPGIQANSRLSFRAYDYNPGGAHLSDTSTCSAALTSSSGVAAQAEASGFKLGDDGSIQRVSP